MPSLNRTDVGHPQQPPPPPPPSPSRNSKWGPYSSAKDFDANMVTILIVLICATILAFSIPAAVRILLRFIRRRGRSSSKREPPKEASLADVLPSLVFSSEGTRLAGEGVECAICLAEFADGDRVRVLPACNHGFHVKCVGEWLSSSSSCPTCRRSCRPVAAPPEEP